MDMEDVTKLMKEAGWGFLATTDGKNVGVRPMGGWAWMEGEIWCASFKASEKVSQLQSVPYAEYCFCDKDAKHVRIAGPCTISSDNDDKARLYTAKPVLKDYIKDPTSPEYVVIRLKPENIRMMDPSDLKYRTIEPTRG